MNNPFLLRTLLAVLAVSVCAVFPASAQKKSPTEQAVLLGQFGDWGAYKADPDPPGRNRDPAYAFVSTRPSEKVKNQISIVVGYPQKPGHDALATIDGSTKYALYTEDDGAWVKNTGEESQMVDAMRKGTSFVITSESSRGTKTTDTYSLKGISEALDKVAAECK